MPYYYKYFETLEKAFKELNGNTENSKLWTVAWFGKGGYYTFWSRRNRGQQMYNIGKTIFEMSDHYGKGKEHGRDLAKTFANLMMSKMDVRKTVPWGGHAEEVLIINFNDILAIAKKREGGSTPKSVTVFNSDSPCTVNDRLPSDNISGRPLSCLCKLVQMSVIHSEMVWQVYYNRRYGALANKQISDYDAQKFLEIMMADCYLSNENSPIKKTKKPSGITVVLKPKDIDNYEKKT